MNTFIFKDYIFDKANCRAEFYYGYDDGRTFVEVVEFTKSSKIYNEDALNKALYLAWVIAGISYYKCFAPDKILFEKHHPNKNQSVFFTTVYRNGLSQFVYENNLDPDKLAIFSGGVESSTPIEYAGKGLLVLQSGGKDSLLLATLLEEKETIYTPWYMQQASTYPIVLDKLNVSPRTIHRTIDRNSLKQAQISGGMNGHVPVTFITLTYALIDLIIHRENTILAAIGREGEEPHAHIGDYAITHQWSKTWTAEKLFSQYVRQEISPDIYVGSPLRSYSELKIAELFVQHCWKRFGHSFSSCNRANYKQGHDNKKLTWCGDCPKCANSYLLFAPFVSSEELSGIFGNNLLANPYLSETFKGLLGVDGVSKPFECIGEIDELRSAYHAALKKGHSKLSFEVPRSEFDKDLKTDAQAWAYQYL